jgi:threonine dehydrogenase-like Zn-dependent dehydrogenase
MAVPGGTIMTIGMSGNKNPLDSADMFYKELTIYGVRLHSPEAFEGAVEIISSKKLNEELQKLIDKVFPLSEIVDAMNYQIEDKEHFKVLIDISK